PALAHAFEALGWKKAGRRSREDLRPDDLLLAYNRVRRRLCHLAGKHFILRRVRELAAVCRRKWSLAGPLALLDAWSAFHPRRSGGQASGRERVRRSVQYPPSSARLLPPCCN